MSDEDYTRFLGLTYDKFRQLAVDPSLSPHEKVGFPNSYREGMEERIVDDIVSKLHNLRARGKLVLDIGSGCSGLARLLLALCERNGHTAILVDSAEMLAHFPDQPFVTKVAAYYPRECASLFEDYKGKIDAILTYSVFQYIFVEYSIFDFLDRSLTLLNDGGEMLIGDIPNVSKRKRFFDSAAGRAYHRAFTHMNEDPAVAFNRPEPGHIDDSVVAAVIARCRASGFDAYVLPQADGLPMANRREDILIRRP